MGEAPGGEEERLGEPLIGPSGDELWATSWSQIGVHRDAWTLGNALLCRPPANDLKKLLRYVAKKRAELKAAGKDEEDCRHPIDACKPQFIDVLSRSENVLMVGAAALWALTGRNRPIKKIRGAMIDAGIEIRTDGTKIPHTKVPDSAAALMQYGDAVRSLTPGGQWRSLKVVPTVHPAFVLRAAEWRVAFENDMRRFWRWARDEEQWSPFDLVIKPTPDQLWRFLNPTDPQEYHAVDIETGGYRRRVRVPAKGGKTRLGWEQLFDARDIFQAEVRCVGYGTETAAYVIPFRSIDRTTTLDGTGAQTDYWNDAERMYKPAKQGAYYSAYDAKAIVEIQREFLMNPRRWKVGHNFIAFDAPILRRVLPLPDFPTPIYNTTLVMRANFSELPRDLYTAGTLMTGVRAWKAAADDRKIARDPANDYELHNYNGHDAVVNRRMTPGLIRGVAERKQNRSLEIDHQIDTICAEMTWLGVRVNEEKRLRLEAEYTERATISLAKIRGILQESDHASWETFRPAQNKAMAHVLYEFWRLPIAGRTPDDDPSVDDATLRKLRGANILDETQLAFVDEIRTYREVTKILSTYVKPLTIGKLVGADGLVHPRYSCHTPRTGRISCRGPNIQNIMALILECLEPLPGHAFIGADFKQIELRIVAALAGIKAFLDALKEPEGIRRRPDGSWAITGDPHSVTAAALYGSIFQKEVDAMIAAGCKNHKEIEKKSDKFGGMRRLAKAFIYAVFYGAQPQTIWETVSAAEDPKTGKLLFPGMQLAEVRVLYRNFMKNMPEMPAFWQSNWDFAQGNGYITEVILGRRRDFPTFNPNEVLNHPIQSSAAGIMSLGLIELRRRVPPQFDKHLGLLGQVHDFAILECEESRVDEMKAIMTESLTQTPPEMKGMVFGADAKHGYTWAAVK